MTLSWMVEAIVSSFFLASATKSLIPSVSTVTSQSSRRSLRHEHSRP